MQKLLTVIGFFLWTPLLWVAEIASVFLNPIAVMLADSATGRLPKIFRWMETPDALGWGAGYYEPAIAKIYDNYGKRIALIVWLWRNRIYALADYWNADFTRKETTLKDWGTREVFKHPNHWWFGTMQDGKSWRFEFSFAISVFGKFNIGMRTGWKLIQFFVNPDWYDNPEARDTGVFTGVTLRTSGPIDS